MQRCSFVAGWVFLLVLLAAPARAKEAPLLAQGQAKALQGVGLALARKGQVDALASLLDVARDLRLDPKSLAKLQDALGVARKRGKKPRDSRPEAKRLRRLGSALVEGLGAAAEARRAHLARCIVRLDDAQAEARQALGHVEQGGRWVPAWLAKLAPRRAEVSELVRKAHRLEVEVATGSADVPILRRLYSRKAAWAASHGLKLCSCTMGELKLERIVRQAVRALALSRALLGQGFEIGTPRKQTIFLVDGVEAYGKAIEEALAGGGLKNDDVAMTRQMGAFFDKRGHLLARWLSEAEAEEGTFYYAAVDQLRALVGGEPQACLLLGHLNWIALRMFGMPLNDATYFDEELHRSRSGPTVTKDPDPVRYERMVRLAKAGLHGSRSWLAYRTKMGVAPDWEASFLDQHGKIRGDDRIKCTVLIEFLQESDALVRLMKESMGADRGDAGAIREALEKALGEKLPSLEKRFAAWLLPEGAGVIQQLERGAGAASGAASDARRSPILRKLTEIRRQALRARENPELLLADDLSHFARLHALYLDRHRDVWTVWPDVHEEFPDREGFSPEGNRAGSHAVIAFQVENAAEAVDQWLGTFYHRLPLLHPGLVGVGWGLEKGIAVLDCQSLVDAGSLGAYVRWPPPDMQGVPTHFRPEIPNPVPGEDQSTWGYPITFQYQGADQQSSLKLSLVAGGSDRGKPVDAHFLSPEAPKNPRLAPSNAWALIPKAPLQSASTYTVVLEGYKDGDSTRRLTWRFRTR